MTLRVGDILYGFCQGDFRLHWRGERRVEAIGADWVVARLIDSEAAPEFAQTNPESLEKFKEREDDESN